jgi:serine/threonine-protein kinase
VLVTVHTGRQFDAAPLVAVDASTGQQQRLLPDAVAAKYLSDGYLLYASGSSLLAAPFDPARIRLGAATPVVDDLGRFIANPLYAISRSGDLAYVPGEPPRPATLVRVDRLGSEQVVANLPEGAGGALSLSPDGRRLALYRSRSHRMWPSLVDVTRGIPEELALDRNAHALVWVPDGRRLVFSSDRDGAANIFVRDAASGGGSDKLVASSQHGDPGSWTRDGLMLAYAEVSPATSWDLWVYNVSTRKAVPFLRTPALERNPTISPDGRWLAYCSNSSGRGEIYAEAFPAGGRRVKISADGGSDPLWSADGRELFYRSDTALMRVGIEEGQDLNPGRPAPLFSVDSFAGDGAFGPVSYAIAADGKSFYFLKPSPQPPAPTRIHVVLGWFDEFARSLKR